MAETIVTVEHDAGLHARPLAIFVKCAKRFDSDIQVENLTNGKGPSNGKSSIKLMLLAVQSGHDIRIVAEGDDSDDAVEALRELIVSDFKSSETQTD